MGSSKLVTLKFIPLKMALNAKVSHPIAIPKKITDLEAAIDVLRLSIASTNETNTVSLVKVSNDIKKKLAEFQEELRKHYKTLISDQEAKLAALKLSLSTGEATYQAEVEKQTAALQLYKDGEDKIIKKFQADAMKGLVDADNAAKLALVKFDDEEKALLAKYNADLAAIKAKRVAQILANELAQATASGKIQVDVTGKWDAYNAKIKALTQAIVTLIISESKKMSDISKNITSAEALLVKYQSYGLSLEELFVSQNASNSKIDCSCVSEEERAALVAKLNAIAAKKS